MQPASLILMEENPRDIKDELMPLLEASWETIKSSYPYSQLKPDFDMYLRLLDADMLKMFTARFDGALIGYALVLLTTHPHRADELVGTIDTIFVLPNFRSRGTADRLLHFVEHTLRMLSVCSIAIASRDDRHERWLKFMGYQHVETILERRL